MAGKPAYLERKWAKLAAATKAGTSSQMEEQARCLHVLNGIVVVKVGRHTGHSAGSASSLRIICIIFKGVSAAGSASVCRCDVVKYDSKPYGPNRNESTPSCSVILNVSALDPLG